MKLKALIPFVCFFLGLIPPEKNVSVSLPVSTWRKNINVIEYTKNFLKASNLPVNNVLPLCDSLTVIQNEIYKQITDTTK